MAGEGLLEIDILVLVGALNGLILPLALGAMLIAANRPAIVGRYRHPRWLTAAGVVEHDVPDTFDFRVVTHAPAPAWGREAVHEYDALGGGRDSALTTTSTDTAPSGPPDGVHLPPDRKSVV